MEDLKGRKSSKQGKRTQGGEAGGVQSHGTPVGRPAPRRDSPLAKLLIQEV